MSVNNMSVIACDKIPVFDQITDNIYIGDITATQSLTILNQIDLIISLVDIPKPEKECFKFPLEDNRNVDISSLFPIIGKIIAENKDKKILVNCYNGVSRSVTILLAYFVFIGISLKDGINKFNKRQQYSRPNVGFMRQLLKYEKEVLGQNSLSLNKFIELTSYI